MKVTVDNHLVGGVHCPSCDRWDGIIKVNSIVVWEFDGATQRDKLRCEHCNTYWETGSWKSIIIEEPDRDIPF